MDKKTYIEDLFRYLKSQKVRQTDINKVIGEYEDLYDEAKDNGLSDDEVIKQLGTPESIYEELKDDLRHEENQTHKIVGITPFVSIIIFFLLGFLANGWTYAWMAFLLIPVTAVILNVKGKDKFVALSPFIAVVTFMLTGFLTGIWYPTWLVFLLIPILAIILNVEDKHKLVALSPFIATIAYFITAFLYPPFYLYGWCVYAFVLLAAAFTDPITWKKLFWAVLTIGAVVAHLLIGFNTGLWQYAWIVYAVPVLFGIFVHELEIRISIFNNWRKNPYLTFIGLSVILIYLVVSIAFNAWYWSWMIILVIPMLGVYSTQKFHYPVAYAPFVATILFYSTGFFLGWWQYSWMFFLMIPILGVLSSHKDEE